MRLSGSAVLASNSRKARGTLTLAMLLLMPRLAPAQNPPSLPPTDTSRRAGVRPGSDSLHQPDARARLPRPLRVCAGGDVTLGTNLDTAWARVAKRTMRDRFAMSDLPDTLLAPLRPMFAGADLVLLNVEGAIGVGRVRSKCRRYSRNCFAFRQPVSAAKALRGVADSAVVVGNVANNHSRDAGPEGFEVTRAHLRRAGVFVTGADTLATRVITPAGDTIGVLGFYTSEETPDARNLDAVRRHVKRAVDRYGTVIVTMHLGAEGAQAQRTFNRSEIFLGNIDRGNPVAFADAAIESGATMVVGHGPHVLRAAEWRDDRLVLYSLGNLLTYGPFGLKEPMNRGAVVCATIDSARSVSGAEIKSTMQLAPGVLFADSTHRAAALIDSLAMLDFPVTGARVDSIGLIKRPATPQPKAPEPVRPDTAIKPRPRD